MKNYTAILLLVATFLFLGCKNKSATPGIEKVILGKWELLSTTNGMTGRPTQYPAGNGNIFTFNSKTFEKFDEGRLTASGSFDVVKDKSQLTNSVGDRLVLGNNSDSRIFITIENDLLYLSPDYPDGGGSTYIRMK